MMKNNYPSIEGREANPGGLIAAAHPGKINKNLSKSQLLGA
jgi:hypothetical protein